MKIAYFDCFAGISGDMTLGALIGVGAHPERLRAALARLGIDGWRLEIGRKTTGHIAATDVRVVVEEEGRHRRRLEDILQIIDRSDLSDWVKDTAKRVFVRLADAEAEVHGTRPDEVHFHEVGAVDAIVDIVGAAVCLELIGKPTVISSPMPTFHGVAQGTHGTFPLPAPATIELLKGVPWRPFDVEGELVTPTGAAIITSIASGFGPMPAMTVESVGSGAGQHVYGFPNVLRVMLGESAESCTPVEHAFLVETNIDDMNPQFYDQVMQRLLAEGALDVYLAPIQMKKNRPGTLLSVLCTRERVPSMAEIILSETSALGVRITQTERICLDRRWEEVETEFGPIRMKIGLMGGRAVNASPEYEDCRRAAEERGVPVRVVYDAAVAAYRRQV